MADLRCIPVIQVRETTSIQCPVHKKVGARTDSRSSGLNRVKENYHGKLHFLYDEFRSDAKDQYWTTTMPSGI